MRGQEGHYGGDSAGGGGGRRAYVGGGGGAAQQHHQSNKAGFYHGRHQEQQPLDDRDGGLQNNQWRWEGDDEQMKLPLTAMSPTAPFSDGQGREMPGYQGRRLIPQVPLERQGGGDTGPQAHKEDMDIGYEDNRVVHTYESLEQRFLDGILKLSKEHADAEDGENARHRERLNAINAQYGEQLAMIRAQHASRRAEFLRRQSQARHHQYPQTLMEQYPASGMGPCDPRTLNAAGGEPHRAHDSNSYRERGRFPPNAREQGYETEVPYPKGRAYNNVRYY